MGINMIYHQFKAKKIILILFGCISIFLSNACTSKYYAELAKPSDKEKVCLFYIDKDSYYKQLVANKDYLNFTLALERINGIFTGEKGIYRSMFISPSDGKRYADRYQQKIDDNNVDAQYGKRCAKYYQQKTDDNNVYEQDGKRCAKYYQQKIDDYNVDAHVSFFSQPLTKPPKGKESKDNKKRGEEGSERQPATQAENDSDDKALQKQVQWVVSSYLYTLDPAHRLDKVYTLVTPIHPGVELIKVEEFYKEKTEKYSTETTKAGITGEFGAQPNMPLPIAATAKLTPSYTRDIQRDLSRKYIVKNAEIFPLRNVLLISQDAGPAGASIGGNAAVNVTISLPPDLCQYFTVFKKGDEQKYEAHPQCYIESVKGLAASLSVVRVVTGGEKTPKEDDDHVTPVAFKNIQVIDLWKNPQFLFGIKLNIDNSAAYPVKFNDKDTSPHLLVFENFEEASSFRDWLVRKVVGAGKQSDFMNGSLDWEDAKDTSIKIGIFQKIDGGQIQAENFKICKAGLSAPDLRDDCIPQPCDLCEYTCEDN